MNLAHPQIHDAAIKPIDALRALRRLRMELARQAVLDGRYLTYYEALGYAITVLEDDMPHKDEKTEH